MDRKRLRQLLHPSRRPAIVVASYGRSGSTLLHQALVHAMSMQRFNRERNLVYEISWTLADRLPRRGTVCKTHDLPYVLSGRSYVRCVFVFARPSDVVRSVIRQRSDKGEAWIERHFSNLRATGTFDELTTRDVLGIETQLDAWTSFTGCAVLCVRYERLWDACSTIGSFTDLPLELPARRDRRGMRLSDEAEDAIASTYAALDERFDGLSDVFQP